MVRDYAQVSVVKWGITCVLSRIRGNLLLGKTVSCVKKSVAVHLAGSVYVGRETLGLGVVSSSPMFYVEITLKKYNLFFLF